LLAVTVSDHFQELNGIAAIELAEGINAGDGRRFDLVLAACGGNVRSAQATAQQSLRVD
jgi:hypothetical protein